MSNLYQDAILDAKALRASAMANAKAALEEAFEPKIQEMISKHLAEKEELDEEEIEEYGAKEEGHDVEGDAKMKGQDADINEAELDEILNQLEEMSSKEDETLKEAEEGEEEGEESEEGGEEEEEDEDVAAGEGEAGAPDKDTKVVELTVGELMTMINAARGEQPDAMADEMPGEEDMPTPDSEAEKEAGDEVAASLEEISLEEILDELENEGIASDVHATSGTAGNTLPGDMEESDLNEKKHKKHDDKKKETKKELEEAKATIETLRKDLQEVNLLNAKYLYMNKLFKSKSLTESQKLKVINTLDRATTVKEVKNAYQIMSESFEIKKGQLKESVGFASKPAGVAPKANIVESEQFINRWQKLAGIKK